MKDVADRVGLSRQLVSLVLRGDPGPSAESRRRILEAAAELGYRPHTSARLLRQGSTHLIGIVFDMRNPFQVRFVEALFTRAEAKGYHLALSPKVQDRTPDEVVERLLEQRVDAIIAFNPGPSATALTAASELLPVAWLGEWVDVPGVDNVHVDERRGLLSAVEHLTALGHRSISYLGGLGGIVGEDRAEAYREAMGEAGLGAEIDVVPSDFTEEDGAGAASALLARARRPSALVCCGDQAATGALAVLALAGIRVPEDISVVGFDDSRLSALPYHRLTSVHQDVQATVDASLHVVLARLADKSRERHVIATPTSLTVRSSTAAVPTA